MKYECENCEYSTDTEKGLNIHIGRVHGKPLEVCGECGEEFEISPSSEREYCSEKCYRRYRREHSSYERGECDACGEEFRYHPSACSGRFCSKECQCEYGVTPAGEEHWNYKEGEEKKCKECGESFSVKPYERHRSFCSQECVGKYDWERSGRNKVERVANDCFECGEKVLRLPSNIHSDENRVFCSEKCRGAWVSRSDLFNSTSVYVEETERTVTSGWEADVDRLLSRSNFEYEYENMTFQIGNGRNYTPDFIVEREIVVEVKGQPSNSSHKRSKLFMDEYGDEYLYVVVGTEMVSHIHISWSEYRSLLEVLDDAL